MDDPEREYFTWQMFVLHLQIVVLQLPAPAPEFSM